uniref:Wsv133-like protein n=1 Tax=Trachysalambria curvirostris nimavirus TaxID=2984282 RepID=A0A9C7BIQ2_9VIRU|nr:MAG: wsv133-like protein [Trachysalambria curvirostris nimavirus]
MSRTDTVAETVAKEYEFYYRNLYSAVIDQKNPLLKKLCADDQRNNEQEGVKKCRFCGQEGNGTSEEVDLHQLISAAAFVGLFTSTGTMTNSHLSTICSRLQKQDQSLAALSYDSYVDIVFSKFTDTGSELLREQTDNDDISSLEKEYADTTRIIRIADDIDFDVTVEEDNHHRPQQARVREDGKLRQEEQQLPSSLLPEKMSLLNSNKLERELTRFHLSDAALHAQALKYEDEAKYNNHRDTVPFTYGKAECDCSQKLEELLERCTGSVTAPLVARDSLEHTLEGP